MDSDEGKLFIGGISWETTEEKLKEHFGQYGGVSQAVIMRDKATGRPRGFGFVVFSDPSILDRVLQDRHTIDGRTVEAKRAMSREEQQASKTTNSNPAGRNGGAGAGGGNIRTKKIFVGGLPPTITEDSFRDYFRTYGDVTDIVIMIDQNTGRPRGFGFVTFDTEEAVDRVLHKNFHDLNGKSVEVKRALPRESNSNNSGGGGGAGRSMGGSGGGGGLYQGSGNTGSNMGGYDTRGDGNRYMQAQQGGGAAGYASYGSGYGTTGYGYGGANAGSGYAGYGYGGMPAGAPRGGWNNQAQTGYGSGGYNTSTAYGGSTGWNTPSGGAGPTAQPTAASTGYGGQGYGYSGYGSEQATGGYGAGYGGAGVNTGYGNTWKPDASQGGGYGTGQVNGPHGGSTGYGGGYGVPQQRPAQ
ncbi:hypothetical protein LUZ61_019252 [Rhynchospora tenuis]|uniref:RRM domain-containing protein n=1 Tax=Rhynchospora tenuis TaxID=198213 RepID=A0AAD5ZAT5_9POAL|nr:hypothetical protein LUZ61_019252 [Rhynchospora tenuis]